MNIELTTGELTCLVHALRFIIRTEPTAGIINELNDLELKLSEALDAEFPDEE